MTGKREAKKEALRQAIINSARQRIADSGLDELRARDIAKDAGCAVGSLYTVFSDVDDVILHVNSGTLTKLGSVMEAATKIADSPEDVLVALVYEVSDRVQLKTGYRIVEGGADNDEVYNFALINYASIGALVYF